MKLKIIKPPSFLDELKMIPHDTRQVFDELDATRDFITLYNKDNNVNYGYEKNKSSDAPDINVINRVNNKMVFGLELREINIQTIKKYAGIEDKWRQEIRKELQNSLDETNLKKGYKFTIFINQAPTIKLLNAVKKLTSDLFSKIIVNNSKKIEKKGPIEGVKYIKVEEWDERKIIGIFPNISVYAYYSENEYKDFYKLIHQALKSKDDYQIYNKYVLVYFPQFDSGIHFEDITFLEACKLVNLNNYRYIEKIYIMRYFFSGGESNYVYFDVEKKKLVS